MLDGGCNIDNFIHLSDIVSSKLRGVQFLDWSRVSVSCPIWAVNEVGAFLRKAEIRTLLLSLASVDRAQTLHQESLASLNFIRQG